MIIDVLMTIKCHEKISRHITEKDLSDLCKAEDVDQDMLYQKMLIQKCFEGVRITRKGEETINKYG